MKIALYIEDGLEQIVLTPEGDTEKAILGKLSDGSRSLEIKHGSFYACKGGWTRYAESNWTSSLYGRSERKDDESTMIVLRPIPAPKEEVQGSVGLEQDGFPS
jgi:hypothetical protein